MLVHALAQPLNLCPRGGVPDPAAAALLAGLDGAGALSRLSAHRPVVCCLPKCFSASSSLDELPILLWEVLIPMIYHRFTIGQGHIAYSLYNTTLKAKARFGRTFPVVC